VVVDAPVTAAAAGSESVAAVASALACASSSSSSSSSFRFSSFSSCGDMDAVLPVLLDAGRGEEREDRTNSWPWGISERGWWGGVIWYQLSLLAIVRSIDPSNLLNGRNVVRTRSADCIGRNAEVFCVCIFGSGCGVV
jgi:hypothetical protein